MTNINPVLFMPQTDNIVDLKRALQEAWGRLATTVNNIDQLYVQATMPTLPENTICLWQDTTNTPNDYYLVGNFGTGTHKLVQLTDALGLVASHKHSALWATDGSPQIIYTDAAGLVGIGAAAESPFIITMQKDQNAETPVQVKNGTVGTAAIATMNVVADAGGIAIGAFSSGYTTSDLAIADSAQIRSWASASGGLTIGSGANAPLILFTQDAERMRIDGAGLVGIGKTNAGYLLDMEASGGGYYSVADHTWHNGSSIRAKENIATLSEPLEVIKKLRGVSWKWKDTGVPGTGLVAEEVYPVVPEVCSVSKTDPNYCDGLAESRLVGYLVEAIKTQQIQIETLQTQIDSLKERLEGVKQ